MKRRDHLRVGRLATFFGRHLHTIPLDDAKAIARNHVILKKRQATEESMVGRNGSWRSFASRYSLRMTRSRRVLRIQRLNDTAYTHGPGCVYVGLRLGWVGATSFRERYGTGHPLEDCEKTSAPRSSPSEGQIKSTTPLTCFSYRLNCGQTL